MVRAGPIAQRPPNPCTQASLLLSAYYSYKMIKRVDRILVTGEVPCGKTWLTFHNRLFLESRCALGLAAVKSLVLRDRGRSPGWAQCIVLEADIC